MKYRKIAMILPISLLSIGCSTDDIVALIGEDTEKIQFNGKVIDGYISGAKVFIDTNGNGVFDSGEPETTSGQDGSYSFDTDIQSGEYRVISEGGVDQSTQKTFDGKLISIVNTDNIEDNLIISPVTTLIAEQFFANKSDGLDKAKTTILTNLNISLDTNILTTDFIEDENMELFKANQNVLKAINNISAVSMEKDDFSSSEAHKIAINTILESETLDSDINIAKLGYQTSTSKAESNDMAYSDIVEDDLSFQEKIKRYQDERDSDFEQFKDDIGKIEDRKDFVKPKTDLSETVENEPLINSKIDNEFKLAKDSVTVKDSPEFKEKVLTYLQDGKSTVTELKNVQAEDIKKEFEKVSADFNVFTKSLELFGNSLDNLPQFNILEMIDITNISELPKTISENGKTVNLTLANNKNGVAIIEVNVVTESLKANGEIELVVDSDGNLTDYYYQNMEPKFTDISGVITAENGSEFDGTILIAENQIEFIGEYTDSDNDIFFDGSFNLKYKEMKPETLEGRVLNGVEDDYLDYKNEITDGYSKYRNQTKDESLEYNQMIKESVSKYENEVKYDYSKFGENIDTDCSKSQSAQNREASMQSVNINVKELKIGDSEMSFKLTSQDEKSLIISDFSLTRGINLSFKFKSAKTGIDFLGSFTDHQEPESCNDYPIEYQDVVSKPVDEVKEVVNRIEEDTASEKETITVVENVVNSNTISDMPPSTPPIKSLKATKNDGNTPPNLPSFSGFKDGNKDSAIQIKELSLQVITENGSVVSAKGDLSYINSIGKFSGILEVDDLSVKGYIKLYEDMRVELDVVINSEDYTNLQLNFLQTVNGGNMMTLQFEDNYKLYIKTYGENISAVDNQGNSMNLE